MRASFAGCHCVGRCWLAGIHDGKLSVRGRNRTLRRRICNKNAQKGQLQGAHLFVVPGLYSAGNKNVKVIRHLCPFLNLSIEYFSALAFALSMKPLQTVVKIEKQAYFPDETRSHHPSIYLCSGRPHLAELSNVQVLCGTAPASSYLGPPVTQMAIPHQSVSKRYELHANTSELKVLCQASSSAPA